MDPSEYPAIPGAEDATEQTTFEASMLKEIIEQVAFAAADDDSRPVFTGVNVEFRTDRQRLPLPMPSDWQCVLRNARGCVSAITHPGKDTLELARILPSEGNVQMIVTTNRSRSFSTRTTSISSHG
jgi:DNA polymerase-3 subunit beta